MQFSDLGLQPELLRAVAEKGYATPTPIQAKAIPAVLSGRDILAGAQTGTGKTAGFVLPVLQRLSAATGHAPRALVLSPTRELTAQIAENAKAYGRYKNLRSLVIFGGVSEKPQIEGLRRGCDLLIATPGRLLDLVEQGYADLSKIECLVLDEADRMLDMGFIHAIKRIIKLLPPQRQNLMFSATYSDDIRELASRILRNPVAVEVAPRNTTAERVDQVAFKVPKEAKRHLLVHLFDHGAQNEGTWHQVLVFTRTKHGANRLAQQLEGAGIRAAAIHGNKSQGARVRALEDFKSGQIAALVATEVASRGLDIKELPQVVNYELPNVPEDYVHRIGRTARAGASGRAVSLVSPDEVGLLRDIEKTMGRAVPVLPTPSFEIKNPQPARQQSSAGQQPVSRQNASPGNRAGSAPRPASHAGRPGSRSHRSGRSRRNRNVS
jgi:ATP-dependent RNA helicase RhlE